MATAQLYCNTHGCGCGFSDTSFRIYIQIHDWQTAKTFYINYRNDMYIMWVNAAKTRSNKEAYHSSETETDYELNYLTNYDGKSENKVPYFIATK
jgi:hypothetical protein